MRKVYAIDNDLLDDLFASARACYPHEFLCMLRAEEGIINGFLIIPGTVFGDSHSFLDTWMAPHDFTVVGTAHSHPGYSNMPSDADIDFFSHYGGVHLIISQPYDMNSWKAYDSKGRQICLEVVDTLF